MPRRAIPRSTSRTPIRPCSCGNSKTGRGYYTGLRDALRPWVSCKRRDWLWPAAANHRQVRRLSFERRPRLTLRELLWRDRNKSRGQCDYVKGVTAALPLQVIDTLGP
jgi:hypothetical protein